MKYDFLHSFLVSQVKPALGCTEPIAIALAVAQARDILGGIIESIEVEVSSNIFKNAMAVTIPNTNERGLDIASALGLIKGDAKKQLEVLSGLTATDIHKAHQFIDKGNIKISLSLEEGFYIKAKVTGEEGWAEIHVRNHHTNTVKAVVNHKVLFNNPPSNNPRNKNTIDLKSYSIKDLIAFCENIPLKDIEFLQEGIDMNKFMSSKGLELKSGLGIGAALKKLVDKGIASNDIINKARITVAAACDARMAGLNYPVMSTMGSGNHGIEAILPLAVIAEENNFPKAKVLRALALSHVITGYVKHHTGTLSPICGCSVAAGAGSAAAITWLLGGNPKQIEGSIKNIIGSLAGMICDGAKGGCALKLSTSAGESIIASQLALEGAIISEHDGIISLTVEETIQNLGRISSQGMINTDNEIISILLNKHEKTAC